MILAIARHIKQIPKGWHDLPKSYDTPSGLGLMKFWFYNNCIPSGFMIEVHNPKGVAVATDDTIQNHPR